MSHLQFHCIKLFILRHAWLNLWDKHMTTGRINQVNIVSTVKRHRNWKQTISNKQARRTQITALASRTTRRKHPPHAARHHAISCRFAFIALSEERQKHRSKPCALADPSSSFHSSKCTSFIHSKPQNHTHKINKHKTKDRSRKRASPIFISAAVSTGFPIQQQQRQSIQF